MDLLSYFRALRRRWAVILLCAVIGAAVGYASTLLDNEEAKKGRTYYKATNTLVLDAVQEDGPLRSSFTNLDQIAILATTGDVPNRVAEELGTSETGRELSERVVTTTNSLTTTLDLTLADPDPDRAVQLADTFAEALIASLDQRDRDRYDEAVADLDSDLTSLQAQANELFARLNTVPPPPDAETIKRQYDATQNNYYAKFGQRQELLTAGPATTSMTVLEPAEAQPIDADEYRTRLDLGALGQNHLRAGFTEEGQADLIVSSSSSFDSPTARTVMGGFLGLLVGVGLALFADRLDRRLRTRDAVEEAYGLPVLAEVPNLSKKEQSETVLVSYSAPLSRVAEAFRAVRTSLVFQQHTALGGAAPPPGGNGAGTAPLFEPAPGDPMVIMVTSAAPREGKTTTSANLAVAFAETDASVLVVNCDFRRPTIHRRFGVEDEPRRVQDTRVPGVKIVTNVLPDPHANPSQVVAAQRQVIAAARGRFDVIILDTAPLLTANDAVDVVGSTDLVVLVAQAGLSTSDNAERVVDVLTRVNAPLGGVVLLATADSSNEYYYYYQRGRVQEPRGSDRATPTPSPAPQANGNGATTDIFGATAPPDDAVTR